MSFLKRYSLIVVTAFFGIYTIACTNTNSEFANSTDQSSGVQKEEGILGTIMNTISSNSMEVLDYVKWIEDPENGLVKTKKLEKYRYSLLYKPNDYMIAKDLAALKIAQAEYDSLQEVYKGFEYYTFSIEDTSFHDELLKSGLTSRGQYDKRLMYYSFEMQKDIQLISGTDTIPCSLLHYERTFNVSPKANFLIGFPVTTKQKKSGKQVSKTFVYEDRVFKTGIVKLRIEDEAIKEIPAIKISK
jgi:hypothetical protein